MKTTFDNKQVASRCYYYLLDFNQQNNWELILEVEPESEGKLFMLTYEQFWKLWKLATEVDSKDNS